MKKILVVVAALAFFASACSGGGGSDLTSDAGEDFTTEVGVAPVFDGCGSSGEITNYQWVVVDGPTEDAAGKELRAVMSDCNFTLENPMAIEDVGEWTIELTVTDGDAEASDQVVVEVTE